jgi:hypothetical protein
MDFTTRLNELFEERTAIWAEYDGTFEDGEYRMELTFDVDLMIWDLVEGK